MVACPSHASCLLIGVVPGYVIGLAGEQDHVVSFAALIEDAARMDPKYDQGVVANWKVTVEVHGDLLAGEVVHGVAGLVQDVGGKLGCVRTLS